MEISKLLKDKELLAEKMFSACLDEIKIESTRVTENKLFIRFLSANKEYFDQPETAFAVILQKDIFIENDWPDEYQHEIMKDDDHKKYWSKMWIPQFCEDWEDEVVIKESESAISDFYRDFTDFVQGDFGGILSLKHSAIVEYISKGIQNSKCVITLAKMKPPFVAETAFGCTDAMYYYIEYGCA